MARYNEFIEKIDHEEEHEEGQKHEVYDPTISDVIQEADQPAPQQGIESNPTSEEIQQDMETGEKDETVYSEEGRENLVEDGQMDSSEAGFMEGAEGRGKKNCCAECGVLISEDDENIVEREFNGEMKWFCCVEHAESYAQKHPDQENPERVE